MNTILPHLFIELYYGGHRMILERYTIDNHILLESYGIYKNCENDAQEILYQIAENGTDIDIRGVFDNSSFFNEVRIRPYEGFNKYQAAYVSDMSSFNTKKFDYITILVSKDGIDDKNAIALIMHELMHAYEDYHFRIKQTTLSNELIKQGYHNNNPFSIKPNEIEHYISYIQYFFNTLERNSYIAQINGELMKVGGDYISLKDALDAIKRTTVYGNYEEVFNYIDSLCSLTDKESIKTLRMSFIKNKYGFVSYENLKKWPYSRIKKWLKYNKMKNQRKINTILPKIASKYIKITKTTPPSSITNIKYKKYGED